MPLKIHVNNNKIPTKNNARIRKKLTCKKKLENLLCAIVYCIFPCLKNIEKKKDKKMAVSMDNYHGGYDTGNNSYQPPKDFDEYLKKYIHAGTHLDAENKNVVYVRNEPRFPHTYTNVVAIRGTTQAEKKYLEAVLKMRPHAKRVFRVKTETVDGVQIDTFKMMKPIDLEIYSDYHSKEPLDNKDMIRVKRLKQTPFAIKV